MIATTTFLLGLLGSLHCIGMCGPIVLALPIHQDGLVTRWLKMLSYNGGRLLTYITLGVIAGTIGKGLGVVGYQQTFSIALGITIVLYFIINKWFNGKIVIIGNPLYKVIYYIKNAFGTFIHKKSAGAMLVVGILNGALPCGLVYMAMATAINANSPLQGGWYMFLFGLGTVPAMLLLKEVTHFLSNPFRIKLQRALPFFTLLIGLLFIVRGLNLGIPYLSPKASEEKTEIKNCCHK